MKYDFIIDDFVWSYSRLQQFEQCPYAFFLKYIHGIPESMDMFFSGYGSLVHRILQQYLEGTLQKEDLEMEFITRYSPIAERAPSERIGETYLEQGAEFFSELPLPARKTLAVEKRLTFQFAGKPFVGIVDWLNEDEDGRLYITDHKTHVLKPRSGRKKPTKGDQELDSYLRQLYMYAEAVHQELDRYPDFLEFNVVRTGQFITEPFEPGRLADVEKWSAEMIAKITDTENWPPKDDYWLCRNICGMGTECSYYRY